jgi:hypothetical protein
MLAQESTRPCYKRLNGVCMAAQNLLMPGDDLAFRVDYKQPYVFGGGDTKKTAFSLSAFNVRKISGVFIPGARCHCIGHPDGTAETPGSINVHIKVCWHAPFSKLVAAMLSCDASV